MSFVNILAHSSTRLGSLTIRCNRAKNWFQTPWNSGHYLLLVIASPFLYSGVKNAYLTCRMRRLNTQEILSDRMTWLHEQMLGDEVDAVLLEQFKERDLSGYAPFFQFRVPAS